MRTMLCFLTLLLTSMGSPLHAESPPLVLKAKFQQAHSGDYIVTAQEKNYALMFIRSTNPATLILEEITVPEEQIDLKTIDWQAWVSNKAPGHTAWTVYEMDLRSGALIEAFSHSQNGWLFLDETQTFLTKLLTLPLREVENSERRKIGPEPQTGHPDVRALWNPPLVVFGKKIPKSQCTVWKTRFPEDPSLLSGCTLTLYFSKSDPHFPFPRWIEVQSPHYNVKLRSVDSGTDLRSPYTGPVPRRPPMK